MSIEASFPTIKPTLNLDFANTQELDPRITFTRASTATYYDGETFAVAEQNLLLRSQEFDNAAWTKGAVTASANSTTAPDGTLSADTITCTAVNATHSINQVVTISAGAISASVFVKTNTATFAALSVNGGVSPNAWAAVVLDTTTGTITQTSNGAGASAVSSSVTSVGNGWYRLSLVATLGTETAIGIRNHIVDTGTPTFTGYAVYLWTAVGTESIYLWGAQVEARSSVTAYTPTTTAPITNYVPVLLTAPAGQARFDHNPNTGESLGLLIEEQRTNLLTYSEAFNNAIWTKDTSGGTLPVVTANQAIAPDGYQTADRIVFNKTGGVFSRIQQQPASTTGVTYTFSVWLKSATGSNVNLGIRLDTTGLNCLVTNEWQRFTVSASATTGSIAAQLLLFDSIIGNDETADVYAWGAQLEAGTFATSYIATTSSQVTRSADSAAITGTNFSQWYNQSEGSLYSNYVVPPNLAGFPSTMGAISDGTTQNFILMYAHTTGLWSNITALNTVQFQAQVLGAPTVGANAKQIVAYRANDAIASVSGQLTAQDTTVSVPVVNQFRIGTNGAGSAYINGTIKKIAYYPGRLTNAQLQALTS